jgi:glycine/D-amino acid oxidase-like deaminating enzyme
MPVRQAPCWIDRFPKTRRPSYTRFRGEAKTDVVIVGGGLTGAACAASFASAGVKVVLLEANAVGGGATAGAMGLVREDFDSLFQDTAAAYGVRSARLLWQGMRRASKDFASALKRHDVRCELSPMDLLRFAPREPESARLLRREYQARRDAGFDHSWVTPATMSRETALDTGGAIRTRGSSLDPYRACLGLIASAASRGAAIHEKSPVKRIRFDRKQVSVTTDAGSITSDALIIATAAALPDLRAVRRHLRPHHTYSVVTEPLTAEMRRNVGRRAAALRDSAPVAHMLRWLKDDRILFSGADQPEVPSRLQDKVLLQRTGQLMYELSVIYPAVSGIQPAWAWSAPRYETVDGLPFIGTHRNFPRHLFAIGEGRHGSAVAWLAARILLRQYQGEPDKGDELFGFARVL